MKKVTEKPKTSKVPIILVFIGVIIGFIGLIGFFIVCGLIIDYFANLLGI